MHDGGMVIGSEESFVLLWIVAAGGVVKLRRLVSLTQMMQELSYRSCQRKRESSYREIYTRYMRAGWCWEEVMQRTGIRNGSAGERWMFDSCIYAGTAGWQNFWRGRRGGEQPEIK